MRYHGEKYRFLHREINDSTKRVVISKAGYVRGRPGSAPDVLMYLSTLHPRPRSVREVFGHVIRPATAQSTREGQSQFNSIHLENISIQVFTFKIQFKFIWNSIQLMYFHLKFNSFENISIQFMYFYLKFNSVHTVFNAIQFIIAASYWK